MKAVELGRRVIRPPTVVATGSDVVVDDEVVVDRVEAVQAAVTRTSRPSTAGPIRESLTDSLYAGARLDSGSVAACRYTGRDRRHPSGDLRARTADR